MVRSDRGVTTLGYVALLFVVAGLVAGLAQPTSPAPPVRRPPTRSARYSTADHAKPKRRPKRSRSKAKGSAGKRPRKPPAQDFGTFTKWEDIGDTVTNCPHGTYNPTQTIDATRTATTSHSTTLSKSTTSGFKLTLGPLSVGSETTTTHSWTDAVSVSNAATIHVPPGHKVSLTAGTEYKRMTGRIRLNYDTRINGHYIWYANYVEAWVPTGYTETGQEDVPCGDKLMNGN